MSKPILIFEGMSVEEFEHWLEDRDARLLARIETIIATPKKTLVDGPALNKALGGISDSCRQSLVREGKIPSKLIGARRMYVIEDVIDALPCDGPKRDNTLTRDATENHELGGVKNA